MRMAYDRKLSDNLTTTVEPNMVLVKGSQIAVWSMNGTTVGSGSVLSVTLPSGWSIVGPK